MAVTLSPTAGERLAQVRCSRKSVTFVSAAGLKVTESSTAAKLFTGWSREFGTTIPLHPVNNFGKPIRDVRRERKSRHECHAPSFARARARRRFFAPWRLCVLAFNRKGAKTQRRGEHGLAASPRDRRVAALGSADTSIAEPAGCRQRRLRVAVPDWTPLARRA